MAINTALLISAPMLQDYLVDKDTGAPLSSGVVTLYQDNSRTTLKNWYYQSGTPGAYTYITLPNPMTLSSVGTIVDGNGNDTIPFFYPYSETDNLTAQPYYITVDNSNGERQFTRQNFPFIAQTPSSNQVPTLENYIINNQFWRNIGSVNVGTLTNFFTLQYNSSGTFYYQTLAPSQHDGFSMPDINYIKSTNGATETITFTKFALGNDPLVGDITPEFYINHNCTASQAGETLKVYQFPISLHVKTLESVQAAITIQAQNVGGNINNTITIYIYQFLGTGVTSSAPIVVQTLTLTNDWQKYVIPFTFPSASGATLGGGSDDALYLQIGMPLTVTCDINFTLPSIYLNSNVPTNYFQTYDQVDSVISTPRTGDIRTSANDFQPFGWLPMNDGTIGDASSNASCYANVYSWPLFNLLWSYSNVYVPMYTSAGALQSRGATAIADFNAHYQLSLPKSLGQVFAGITSVLPSGFSQTFTTSNASNSDLTVTSSAVFGTGTPIVLTNSGGSLPTGLSTGTIYYSIFLTATTMQLAATIQDALAGNPVMFTGGSGSGTNTIQITNNIGAYFYGEINHIQSISELAAHSHTLSPYTDSTAASGSGVRAFTSSGFLTTSTVGSSSPMNVTQPTTYMNVFIKL